MKTVKTPNKNTGSRFAESAKTIKTSRPAKLSRTHKPEDMTLEEWQRQLRVEYGTSQEFILENRGSHPVFSEFTLTNPVSNRTYRIAIRGDQAGDNFCSCPDFRINGLGVCKHSAVPHGTGAGACTTAGRGRKNIQNYQWRGHLDKSTYRVGGC